MEGCVVTHDCVCRLKGKSIRLLRFCFCLLGFFFFFFFEATLLSDIPKAGRGNEQACRKSPKLSPYSVIK